MEPTGRITDPNNPGKKRSARVAGLEAKAQLARQQAQAPAPTASKPKKRAPAKKTAASTSGVKKATTKGKAAGAGKKAGKAPAAKSATKKAAAKAPAKKAPVKKTAAKRKGPPSVEQESDEEEAVPDQDQDEEEARPDPAVSAVQQEGDDADDDEADEAAAAAIARQEQEDAEAAQPAAAPVTHEEVEEAVAARLQHEQDQTARPTAPPVVTYEEVPAPDQVRLSYPGYGGSRRNLGWQDMNVRGPPTLSEQAFSTIQDELEYSNVQWVRATSIGKGAFGRADLYVRLDPVGNITHRMVVKTTSLPHHVWIMARQWHIDESDPTKRQHMEIKVMEEIAGVAGDHKCVRLQNATIDRSRFMYSLYTPFYPRGDLSDFIMPWSEYMHSGKMIPEPVLWKWLEDLTEASLLMSTGAAPQSAGVDGWKKIVHCDFKPSNVFLDNPDAELWRSYPQAIVGDFGLAIFTDENDPFNPSWYNAINTGTPGYKPPEQVAMVDSNSGRIADMGKFGDASNVWGIGATIMRLMNRERDAAQPRYAEDVRGQMEPQLHESAKDFYSKYLCDLVVGCVQFRTYYRTDLLELWSKITRYTHRTNAAYESAIDGDDEDEVEALKRNIRKQKYGDDGDDGDDSNNENHLVYAQEKYRIGMAITDQGEQGDDSQNQDDENPQDDNPHDDSQQDMGQGLMEQLGLGMGMGGVDPFGGALDDELPRGGRGRYPGARALDENYDDEEEEVEEDEDEDEGGYGY